MAAIRLGVDGLDVRPPRIGARVVPLRVAGLLSAPLSLPCRSA